MIINQTGGGNADAMIQAKYSLSISAGYSDDVQYIEFYDVGQDAWVKSENDWADMQDFSVWFQNTNGFRQISILCPSEEFAGYNEFNGKMLIAATYDYYDENTSETTVIRTIPFAQYGCSLEEEVIDTVHNLWLNISLPESVSYTTEANVEDPTAWISVDAIRIRVSSYDTDYGEYEFPEHPRVPMMV